MAPAGWPSPGARTIGGDPMIDRSLAHAAQPLTREQRGLELASSRFEDIYPVSNGTWRVPSSTDECIYLVRLRHESCTCPDHRRSGAACKHVYAAHVVKAKTAECAGCGSRFRYRKLIEVGDDHLTYFEGDVVGEECAARAGVI